MALFKFFKTENQEAEANLHSDSMCKGSLTEFQLEAANKAVLEACKEKMDVKRDKYNHYTTEERAEIGKYTSEMDLREQLHIFQLVVFHQST